MDGIKKLTSNVKLAGTAAIRLKPKTRALESQRAPSKEETDLMNKINELVKKKFFNKKIRINKITKNYLKVQKNISGQSFTINKQKIQPTSVKSNFTL